MRGEGERGGEGGVVIGREGDGYGCFADSALALRILMDWDECYEERGPSLGRH